MTRVSVAAALLCLAAFGPAWADGLVNRATLPSVVTPPPPNWATYSTHVEGFSVNLGNFPRSALFGADQFGLTAAFASMMDMPANANGAPSFAIAGYARSASPNAGAVGLYGQGMQNADHVQSWGLNTVTTNCGAATCPANTGHTGGFGYGYEINMNYATLPDGTSPTGAFYGIYMTGAGNARPTGGMRAMWIDPPGRYANPVVKWNNAIWLADGSSDQGIFVGAQGLVGAGPSASQGLLLNAYASDGTGRQAVITEDTSGNILLQPSNASVLLGGYASVGAGGYASTLPLSAGVITATHIASSGAAPTLPSCGTSPALKAGSNDTRGTVTVGNAGVTGCQVNFAAFFASAPFCTVSSNTPGIAPAIVLVTTGALVIGFPAGVPATLTATWQCIQ